ncbi:TM2 domain-containing protein [uncultured Winogradskyella sp.]|uniref:TM2 domain-containing protein n=1 Tax=uncultured Winogradskyella sp. TaxID=395353 RepID=UPI002614266F|nr:TM2 domain-containing protein [uncultured Winogradskyella sp.]
MKIKLFLSAFLMMFVFGSSYASFPVDRPTATAETENVSANDVVKTQAMSTPVARAGNQSKGIAILLWFFLGGLAAHRWYLKSPVGWNILFILTFGGLGIWWIIDLIDIFNENYPNANFKSDFF